ncbi:hypothetical protein EMCRGX_G023797 [Ephydatia muelleri]
MLEGCQVVAPNVSRGKQRYAEESRGMQRKAEVCRGKQRYAEMCRGKQRYTETEDQLCSIETNLGVVYTQSHIPIPPTSCHTPSHLILTKHPMLGEVVVEVTAIHEVQYETQLLIGLEGVVQVDNKWTADLQGEKKTSPLTRHP